MTLLDLVIAPAHAQAAAPAPAAPGLMSFLPFVIILFVMYFLMIRPQMKRAKDHKAMVEKLSVGDEVITNGGIAGVVRGVGSNFITVEIAERVEVRVQKGAVGNVLPKGSLKSA